VWIGTILVFARLAGFTAPDDQQDGTYQRNEVKENIPTTPACVMQATESNSPSGEYKCEYCQPTDDWNPTNKHYQKLEKNPIPILCDSSTASEIGIVLEASLDGTAKG
jgi:hypothetical protein